MTRDAVFFGIFIGLIGAVAIYHLLMYAILRVSAFLSYGAYLAALTVFQFARNPAYLAAFGWRADGRFVFYWSLAALAFLGYWLFRTFLDLPATQPRTARVFLLLACVTSAAALGAPLLPHAVDIVVEVCAVAVLIAAASALLGALRLRLRVATYFGIAYAGFFAGAVMRVAWLSVHGALGPLASVCEHGVEFGVAFQALALALGLADRIAAANEERDRAQRRTIEEIGSLNVAYARFVPQAFLDLLGKHDVRDVRLGDGIEREMTVLFSDVRSFTTISEALAPHETFGFINDLLSRMGPVIREYGGIVDKYVGDAIMALFPGPADDALQAAIALQHAVDAVNAERARAALEPIAVGVGLHRGSLMLGTIGEHERMDGTVIADAVNVASRVEGLTKYFGARVIVTGDVRRALREPAAYTMRSLGAVAVKGKRSGVTVFEVLDGDSLERMMQKRATAAAFTAAVDAFVAGAFAAAAAGFSNVLALDGADGAARYLQDRSLALAGSAAPWEGVDTAAK